MYISGYALCILYRIVCMMVYKCVENQNNIQSFGWLKIHSHADTIQKCNEQKDYMLTFYTHQFSSYSRFQFPHCLLFRLALHPFALSSLRLYTANVCMCVFMLPCTSHAVRRKLYPCFGTPARAVHIECFTQNISGYIHFVYTASNRVCIFSVYM